MDPKFADQVLSEAVKRGNSPEDLQKHLDTLDAAGQAQFIQEAAKAFGIANEAPTPQSLGPSQGQEQRAQATPDASYYPDNPSGSQQTVAQEAFKPVKDLLHSGVEALPAAGAMVGGSLGASVGAAAGGIGAVPGGFAGAATGGAIGASLENGLKSILWPEEASTGIVGGLVKAGKGAAEGLAMEAGGKLMSGAAEGVGVTTKAIGDRLGSVGKMLAKPAAGAITGAAAGGMLAGASGAKVGAVVGAVGGSGAIEKLAKWYKNPLAAEVPELSAKAAEDMLKAKRMAGQQLGETSKAVDAALKEAQLPEGPYMTKAEMGNHIEKQIQQDVIESGGNKPETYWKALRREINNWLGVAKEPNQVMTARRTQVTASNINRSTSGRFGESTAQSLKEIRTDIAAKMRQYNDNLVLKTGDDALINQWTVQKEQFSALAKDAPNAQKVVRATRAASDRQKALNYTAKLLAQGPDVLGKSYYNRLHRATIGRGLAGASITAAHLLYKDQKFADLVDSLNLNESDQTDNASQTELK